MASFPASRLGSPRPSPSPRRPGSWPGRHCVLARTRHRRLEPRLGRWWAAPRLHHPSSPRHPLQLLPRRDRGAWHPLKVAQKSGDVQNRMLVQAGQVLLSAPTRGARQLATLTRRQLRGCLQELVRQSGTADSRLSVMDWNGAPVAGTPAAGLLGELGFRYDSQGCLCWPPPRAGAAPTSSNPGRLPALLPGLGGSLL